MSESATDDLLSAYLDGQLGDTERGRLELRITKEPDLARRLETLRAADGAARDWFAGALTDAPPATAACVRRGFRRRRNQHRDGAGFAGFNRWLAPVAAVAAVIVIGLIGFNYEVERRVDNVVAQMRSERTADLKLLANAMQEVLETRESGTPVSYRSDQTGFSVTIVPQRTWRSQSGHWCRQFSEIFVDGTAEDAPVSVACRDSQGHWRRVRTELRNPSAPPLPVEFGGTRL